MTAPDAGMTRLLRALVLAVATVALAALAHLVGGGCAPGPVAVGLLLALTTTGCLVASAHRLGPVALTALLAGGQATLHVGLTLLDAPAAAPAHAVHVALATGHHHGHLAVAPGAPQVASLDHLAAHAGHAHHLSAAMLLAHLVATVLTALLLARGERALWLLAGWLAPVVRALVARPADWPRPVRPRSVVARLRGADLVLAAPLRGPPVACA